MMRCFMRVLVTGGAGFMGSHLYERLVVEGHDPSIIDELNDFYSPADKLANLHSIAKSGPVEFQEAIICDMKAMTSIFARREPERIAHLAARAGVRPSLDDPLPYEEVIVHGTLVLLERCRLTRPPRVVISRTGVTVNVAL
jgi:UDP-glucuronate 4-epimerase